MGEREVVISKKNSNLLCRSLEDKLKAKNERTLQISPQKTHINPTLHVLKNDHFPERGHKPYGTERGSSHRTRQGHRACSSSTTLLCPFLAARKSGLSPDVLELLGLTSSRPKSRYTISS